MTLILDPNDPIVSEYLKGPKPEKKRYTIRHRASIRLKEGCEELSRYNIDHTISANQIRNFLAHGFTLGMLSTVTGARIQTLSHRIKTDCKQRLKQKYHRKPKEHNEDHYQKQA